MAQAPAALGQLLAQVVPGSPLREGLERILGAHMGALIVLGDGPEVLAICSGGFHIDTEMTPQRLSELAKMDGAMVLDREAKRIVWVNVHLIPDPSAFTIETGTRHRTAERVARCVGVPVVAVSEETGRITLYERDARRQLQPTDALVGRANHLLQTLDRFRARFDEVNGSLGASEIADMVTVRDVATVLQRAEMVARVADAIADVLDELGEHGRLLRLQLNELTSGVFEDRRLVAADYVAPGQGDAVDQTLARLAAIPADDLLGLDHVVRAFRPGSTVPLDLDAPLVPRGYRLLRRLPEMSRAEVERLVAHFGDLHRLLRAPAGELAEAAEIGEDQARLVKGRLARVADAGALDRFG
ncbi:MAG TPA: DNA integrity scanning diadenylate cyclase DisA [Acidimicrobiales bacterium]|nr:DNA integrity scanning diadenylate cyclase DisA [Acidimicrobiales bacterium]